MVRRHELTDEQWSLIQDLLPMVSDTGRPREDDRAVMNGIFWILNTGAPWRDLPARYGHHKTVFHRFSQYREDGTFERILECLQMKLDDEGMIDWELFCVDGSSVRATRSAGGAKKRGPLNEPADHALGMSRGGWGTKLHLVTDGEGLPLAVHVTPGQRHESTQFEAILDAVRVPQPRGRPRQRPDAVSGDKAFSIPRIRDWLKRRRIEDNIPTKSDQSRDPKFDKVKYRRRNVVERCIGWLKECRRIATRYEKLAVNYLAMVQLGMIQRYLRMQFSDRA
jgi:transposase